MKTVIVPPLTIVSTESKHASSSTPFATVSTTTFEPRSTRIDKPFSNLIPKILYRRRKMFKKITYFTSSLMYFSFQNGILFLWLTYLKYFYFFHNDEIIVNFAKTDVFVCFSITRIVSKHTSSKTIWFRLTTTEPRRARSNK